MDKCGELPPVIRMLLDEEKAAWKTPDDVKRYVKNLWKDLRQQAESTTADVYVNDRDLASGSGLSITAMGSLNPTEGICSEIKCRLATAEQFARTVGLYADVVGIPDVITPSVLLRSGKMSDRDYADFLKQLLVLKVLEPLIREGIVRFRTPMLGFCRDCHKRFEDRLEGALDVIYPKIERELKFEVSKRMLIAHCQGGLWDWGGVLYLPIKGKMRKQLKSGKTVDEVGKLGFLEFLRDRLEAIFTDMAVAKRCNSTVFSTSRFDMLSLNALEDGVSPDLTNLEIWEASRSIELPWVKDLSSREVVILRQEAGKALPRLREKVLQMVTSPVKNPSELIAELRSEAMEVEAEIKAVNPRRGENFRNVAGVLGITMAVYGFGSGFIQPGMALPMLVTLLGLLHTSARQDEQKMASLESRPGYVLLKARELVEHSEGH
jgi:hypothetical protein